MLKLGLRAQILVFHFVEIILLSAVAFFGLSIPAFASEELPTTFTYQGRFMNAAGTAPVADGAYTVKFGVYDPSGVCLLYEESQSITTVNGFFSAQVGSSTVSAKRTANNPNQGTPALRLSMQDIFSNKQKTLVKTTDTASCAADYNPAVGDGRSLRVTNVTLGVTLTPDQTISSVPTAVVAESVQGISPENFLQYYPLGVPGAGTTLGTGTIAIDGAAAGQAKVWSGAAWSVTSVLNPNALTQAGAAASQVLKWNGAAWAPANDADTAASNMNGDVQGPYTSNNVMKLQGRTLSSAAPSNGDVLAWNGANWVPTAPGSSTPTGAAGGDLTATYPNPNVAKIQGVPVISAAPSSGDVLRFMAGSWQATSDSAAGPAGGDLVGTYPNPNVAKLQGNAVSSTAPSTNQILTWNGASWAPTDLSALGVGQYVKITGDTMSGNLHMNGANKVVGMIDPTSAQDASTKNYTDLHLAGLNLNTLTLSDGQVLRWVAGSSRWEPYSPVGGGGTVTSVVAGAGLVPNTITTSGTLDVDTALMNNTYVNVTGDTMSGILDLGSHKINNVTDPTAAQDASTKNYADTHVLGLAGNTTGITNGNVLQWNGAAWVPYDAQTANDSRYINAVGDTMSGILYMSDNINMSGHTIINLAAPVANTDASTKIYVDNALGGLNSQYVAKAGDTMSGLLNIASSLTVSGNVGIGTTAPTNQLDLFKASGATMGVRSTAGDSVLTIKSTLQNANLDIDGGGGGGADPTINFKAIGTSKAAITFDTGTNIFSMGTSGGNALTLNTSGTEQLRIDSAGKVGIGTSAPGVTLEVKGAAAPVIVNSSNSNQNKIGLSDNGTIRGYIGGSANAAFAVQDSVGNERLTVQPGGNIGIGTPSPGQTLSIAGSTTNEANSFMTATYNTQMAIDSGTTVNKWRSIDLGGGGAVLGRLGVQYTGAGSYMALGTTNTFTGISNQALTIDPAGKVGVGTTSPQRGLEVAGGGPALAVNGNAGTLRITTTSTSVSVGEEAAVLEFYSNDTSAGATGIVGSVNAVNINGGSFAGLDYGLSFKTGRPATLGERMRIDHLGNVGIGTNAPIFPLSLSPPGGSAEPNIALQTGFGGSIGWSSGANTWRWAFREQGGTGDMALSRNTGASIPFIVKGDSGNVGIGPSAPDAQLAVGNNITSLNAPGANYPGTIVHIVGADGTTARELIDAHGASGAYLTLRKSEGTAAAPTAVLANGIIGSVAAGGYGATAYQGRSAAISFYATENWTDAATGTSINFWTTANGSNGAAMANRMTINHNGNVGFGVVNPTHPIDHSSGAYLSGGGVWTNASNRYIKENFVELNKEEILEKINELPVTQWNYKKESADITHIGPMAQDFYSIFHLGGSDTSISSIDPAGIALVGIQALTNRCEMTQKQIEDIRAHVEQHDRDIASLKQENQNMKSEIQDLREQIRLINSKLGN